MYGTFDLVPVEKRVHEEPDQLDHHRAHYKPLEAARQQGDLTSFGGLVPPPIPYLTIPYARSAEEQFDKFHQKTPGQRSNHGSSETRITSPRDVARGRATSRTVVSRLRRAANDGARLKKSISCSPSAARRHRSPAPPSRTVCGRADQPRAWCSRSRALAPRRAQSPTLAPRRAHLRHGLLACPLT